MGGRLGYAGRMLPVPWPRSASAALALVALVLGAGCDAEGGAAPVGQVTLAESHTTAQATPVPVVSAAFLSAAVAPVPARCTTSAGAGCVLSLTPVCPAACPSGQACQYDAACRPTCAPGCALSCPTGQSCAFSAAGIPACVPAPPGLGIDAGALWLSGPGVPDALRPIQMDPPYLYAGPQVAPFVPAAAVTVQAAGADDRGFDAFTADFTTTSFMKTTLGRLGLLQVFEGGDVPISWTPGAGPDVVTVRARGPGGTAVCPARDADGRLDLPRAVVQVVIGPRPAAAVLTIEVTRQRAETRLNLPTRGLSAPAGQVTLLTRSTEGASFQCRIRCGGACVDAQFSNQDCGTCGNACKPTEACTQGQCQPCLLADQGRCGACDACLSTRPSCADASAACSAEPDCGALRTCLGPCATAQCRRDCAAAHPTGAAVYNALLSCVCAPCQTECARSLICTVYPL